MLDLRNRELAEAAKVDDFIVSEHLISLMLAQLSENAELMHIFENISIPKARRSISNPSAIMLSPDNPSIFTPSPKPQNTAAKPPSATA
jgi:ion channel POLLUX/CASTOR